MTIASPWMLLSLLALPILVGVYLLRNRSRRVNVSSLILWVDQRSARRGGRILERLQTPLSLFLEVLALALLAFAAAGPAWSSSSSARSLVVVLDDSYSMQARNAQATPRQQAEEALLEECRRAAFDIRFVLAGPQPRLLGELLDNPGSVRDLLPQWQCQRSGADITKAIALAEEIGGPRSQVLVLTDHAPAEPMEGGRIEWWSFGNSLPNWAFTTATRTEHHGQERILLEISNLSSKPSRTELTLSGEGLEVPPKSILELPAAGKKRLIFSLPSGSPTLEARLAADPLAIDNQVTLLSASERLLRVNVELKDERLRRAVEHALESTEETTPAVDQADLRISDSSGPMERDTWRLDILGTGEANSYSGPFVIDRSHPLTRGLSLQSAIWSVAPKESLRGLPFIMAGNVPLLSEEIDAFGRHRWQMGLIVEQSNLQDLQDWPILFANIIESRRQGLPGVTEPNVRLGDSVNVTLPDGVEEVTHTVVGSSTPNPHPLTVRGSNLLLVAEEIGVHLVKAKETEYRFATNALSADESNLSTHTTQRWGDWQTSVVQRERSLDLRPYLLIAALAALSGHLALIASKGAGE